MQLAIEMMLMLCSVSAVVDSVRRCSFVSIDIITNGNPETGATFPDHNFMQNGDYETSFRGIIVHLSGWRNPKDLFPVLGEIYDRQ